MNWASLLLAAVFGTPAVVMLVRRKAPRTAAILAALAALCLLSGIPSLLAALGHPLGAGPVLLGIVILAIGFAMFFYLDVIRGEHKTPLFKGKGGGAARGARCGRQGQPSRPPAGRQRRPGRGRADDRDELRGRVGYRQRLLPDRHDDHAPAGSLTMGRAPAGLPSGDLEPVEGVVVPGPACPRMRRRGPPFPAGGRVAAMWAHHGPFVRPFLWLPGIWLDAAAAHAVSPLAVQVLLAAGPVAGIAWAEAPRSPQGLPACTWPCP